MTKPTPTSLAPPKRTYADRRTSCDLPLSPDILQRLTKREFFEVLGYRPHRGQERIHRCRKRFIVAICGRRWGKTLAAAREAEYAAMKPGARIYVVAPYQHLATRVFFQVWRDLLLRLRIPVEAKSRTDLYLRLPWDAVIEGRSADRPENLVGEGLDLIVFDEAAKARGDVWQQYLVPSLMDKRGRALFISTPEGFNWLYRLYLLGRSRKRSGAARDWHAFSSPSTANPHLPREELALTGRLLSDFAYRQEILAEFTRCENLVYPAFSHERHVQPLTYDPRLPLYRALDFGYVNPFVCLTIQVAPGDVVRVLDEIYLRGRTIAELAELMLQSLAPHFEVFRKFWLEGGYLRAHSRSSFRPTANNQHSPAVAGPATAPTHPLTGAPRFPQNLAQFNESVVYFCDPSGAGERATLRDLGFFTQARPSPLPLGIELIRRALGSSVGRGLRAAPSSSDDRRLPAGASAEAGVMTDDCRKPTRLLVSPSCPNLIREFTSYRYPDSVGLSAVAGGAFSESRGPAAFPGGSSPSTDDSSSDPSSLTTDDGRLPAEAGLTTASESPLKQMDHALDALRYFFVGLWG